MSNRALIPKLLHWTIWGIALAVAVVFFGSGLITLAAAAAPGARAAWLTVSGRSHGCGFSGALQAIRYNTRYKELEMHHYRASKLVTSDRHFELWRTEKGDFWAPVKEGFDLFVTLAEQDNDIYAPRAHKVKRGDVVLDCGANLGTFTRNALNDGAGTVVAIEPDPSNCECMRRTFAREIAEGRVILYPKGVWDKEDTLKLHVHPENSLMHSLVVEWIKGMPTISVPVTTIDKLVQELRLEKVSFIKMDIEGAERKALSGSTETMRRWKPRLAISSYHLRDDTDVLPRVVHQAVPDYAMEVTTYRIWQNRVAPETQFFY